MATSLNTYLARARARVEADPLILFGMVGGAYALRANRTLLYVLGAIGAWWLLREPSKASDPAAPGAAPAPSPVPGVGMDPRLVVDPRQFGSPDVARNQFEAWVRANGAAAAPPAIQGPQVLMRGAAPGEW
jgi:hypothetical protein